uniref:Uncharacterized protein n=1 Tax=Romanomermis culicivorax TaxID=13658 RepID=A0A915KB27_ROMCU
MLVTEKEKFLKKVREENKDISVDAIQPRAERQGENGFVTQDDHLTRTRSVTIYGKRSTINFVNEAKAKRLESKKVDVNGSARHTSPLLPAKIHLHDLSGDLKTMIFIRNFKINN